MQANPVVLYHLGMAYWKNNQDKEAKWALEQALELSNEFPGSSEARRVLEELGGKQE
jgi:uncharacterized protein HemY